MFINARKCLLSNRKKMAVRLWQFAKNASFPNQQEHTTVVSATGESMKLVDLGNTPSMFFYCIAPSLQIKAV